MARENKNIVVGLDIGTSKVACLVADITPDGRLEVLGMGSHESKGLKKGVVVNIEATVAAIRRALEEAELMADCKITSAYVGIAGSHIRSFNSTGMVAVKDREVGVMDVDRAIETARAVNIPTDQQILHVLRQEFIIDGQEDVREPIGMSGVRLEVKVHIVTGAFHHGLRRTIALGLGVLLGAQFGARFSHHVRGQWIVRSLAVALGLVGIRILVLAFA